MQKVIELVEKIKLYAARFVTDKFSGKVIFVLHWRDGGIGRVEVEIKHDI